MLKGYIERLLDSFSIPSYRWLWASILFGTMRLITIFVARGWLVLTLTDSPFWVGAAVALRGGVQILLGVFSGVLLDRVNRRWMLFAVELGISLGALVIGLLVWLDQIALWHILMVSAVEGIFVSIRWPAINTLIYETVGPKRLLNASAAQLLGFNIGNITASAIGGLLVATFGVEFAYFVGAGYGFIGAFFLFFVQSAFQPASASRETFKQSLQAGLNYIRATPALQQLMFLSFVMSFLGWSHISMLPVMVRDVLGLEANSLGFLMSAGGTGALLATAIVAGLGDYQNKVQLILWNGLLTATMLILFALSPWYLPSLGLIALMHGALMAFEAVVVTTVQLITDDAIQGRVQGIYALVFGFTWFGGLAMGAIASLSGAPLAIGLGGAAVAVAMLSLWRPLQRIQLAH